MQNHGGGVQWLFDLFGTNRMAFGYRFKICECREVKAITAQNNSLLFFVPELIYTELYESMSSICF